MIRCAASRLRFKVKDATIHPIRTELSRIKSLTYSRVTVLARKVKMAKESLGFVFHSEVNRAEIISTSSVNLVKRETDSERDMLAISSIPAITICWFFSFNRSRQLLQQPLIIILSKSL